MVRIYEEGAGDLVPSRGYGRVGRANRPRSRVSPYSWLPYIKRYAPELKSSLGISYGKLSVPRGPFIKNFGDKLAQDTGLNSLSTIGSAGQRLYNWEKSALSRGLNWVAKRFKKGKRGQGLSIEDLDDSMPTRIDFGGIKHGGNGGARPPYSGSKRSYNTTGHGGGKFRGRKIRKINKAAYRGVQLSREVQQTFSPATCGYVGHNSHPLEDMVRSIGLALVRFVAKKWHQDFNNFESFVNGDTSAADSSLKITMTYRDSREGILKSHNFTQTNKSWYQVGDQFMHQLIQLMTLADSDYWEMHQVIFSNSSGTVGNAQNLMKFDCSGLKFKISGWSIMKIQNRTVSTSGDTLASEQMHDVANNPLSGKLYKGFGQQHPFVFNNDYGTNTNMFTYDNTGSFNFSADNTTLPDPMQKVLKRPPSHKAFKGLKSHIPVKLNPGEIKHSVVRATYTHGFNTWIKKLFNVLKASTDLAAVTPAMCTIGNSAVIGLQHTLIDSADPTISVSYQIDSIVSCICSYRSLPVSAPVFDREIETKVLLP